jgi:hypothetical protein
MPSLMQVSAPICTGTEVDAVTDTVRCGRPSRHMAIRSRLDIGQSRRRELAIENRSWQEVGGLRSSATISTVARVGALLILQAIERGLPMARDSARGR